MTICSSREYCLRGGQAGEIHGVYSYAIAGAVAVTLLFIAVKAIVYVVPISLGILLFPPPEHHRKRWQLAGAWMGGVAAALLLIRASYGAGGAWDVYLSVFRGVSKYSAGSGEVDTSGPPFYSPSY